MKTPASPKQITLVLLATFVNFLLSAQTTPPPKQWDKRFGGHFIDNFSSLAQTTDSGYILGGSSLSEIGGDKTQGSRGAYDYWIVKTDVTGIKQWDKRFGGKGNDFMSFVQQTTDGGYILGGNSSSGMGGDKSQGSRGDDDYWIVKVDGNGIKQWDKRFGGTSADYLSALQQTSDGGYIMGGSSASGMGGDKTEPGRGSFDYWVVKVDANGVKQWDKRFGGTNWDQLSALQQTKDGEYILGGYSYSGVGGDKTQDSRGGADYWIVKIDAQGNLLGDNRFGGTDNDFLFSLQQTKDRGYILGGNSWSGIGGDKTEASRGSYDYWIVKIGAGGTSHWDKCFGGSSQDGLRSVQQTSDGGYILGGSSWSGISGDKTESSRGLFDYWIVKTDDNGMMQWDKRFGGNNDDYFGSLRQTADSGYVVGGSSYSGIDGDKTQAGRGVNDYWMIKIGCPPAAVITSDGNTDICATGSVTLKIATTDTLQYKWRRNNENIKGATQWYYTATTPGKYKVIVFAGDNCKATSNIITVTQSCITTSTNNSALDITRNAPSSATLLSPAPLERAGIRPNPSNGNITVMYESVLKASLQLEVLDMAGKQLYATTKVAIPGKNVFALNLTHLANGIYTIRITNGSEQQHIRFVLYK